MVTALKAGHKDERQYHNEMISDRQAQCQRLQTRIDGMYLDKLDGRITSLFYDLKSEEWRAEQAEISRKIENHRNANCSYMDEGVRLLELAQKAPSLYEKQEMEEKTRLLNFVFSN